jgi:hypothetical protein
LLRSHHCTIDFRGYFTASMELRRQLFVGHF